MIFIQKYIESRKYIKTCDINSEIIFYSYKQFWVIGQKVLLLMPMELVKY